MECKILEVTINVGEKSYTRQVYAKRDSKRSPMCHGRIGKCAFVWNPQVYDYPRLQLTYSQKERLFKDCHNSKERTMAYKRVSSLAKDFLMAYKEELKRDRKAIPKREVVPEGFKALGQFMFDPMKGKGGEQL